MRWKPDAAPARPDAGYPASVTCGDALESSAPPALPKNIIALLGDGMGPVQVRAGQYAIFYPDDAHIPSCAWGAPAEVLKVVVKVKV